jgi:hypothetical protein
MLRSPTVAIIIFTAFTMAFLTLSALLQSWDLYRRRQTDLQVVAIQRTKEYGGEYVTAL